MLSPSDHERVAASVERIARSLKRGRTLPVKGRVRRALGTIIRATVPEVRLGELCWLQDPFHHGRLLAEVTAFEEDEVLLVPLGDTVGLSTRTEVIATGTQQTIQVGDHLLGRVLDGMGRPLDGQALPPGGVAVPVQRAPPPALSRRLIDRPLPIGLRVIDGLLTCAEGQRIGIFGPAGCGKSTLVATVARHAEAELAVLALIGERGREVREFLERVLGEEGRRRAVVVVATSDRPAIERLKAAYTATAVAEHFRDRGRRVLLIMDSVTRFARALREVGLAAGELPTRRGFPPSVFAALPRLVERAGQGDAGSITAFYNVLVEGEQESDPIAEEMRGLLDGHIVLSRQLAGAGHYPAIAVTESTSRVMPSVAAAEHMQAADKVRRLLAKYEEVELLLQVGEYQRGADPVVDLAIDRRGPIEAFLKQGTDPTAWPDTLRQLAELAA